MSRRQIRDFACPFCGANPAEPCRGSVRAGRGRREVGYHNARRDVAREANQAERNEEDTRAQHDLIAAGWLPPDEAARLREERDHLAVAFTVAVDVARQTGEDVDQAETALNQVESQVAVLLPVIKLLWPEGGAKRVPHERVSQLPEAVEWLLQQRVSLTELLDKAERERDEAQTALRDWKHGQRINEAGLLGKIRELEVVLGTIREGDDHDPGALVMLYDQAVDRLAEAEAHLQDAESQLAAVQPVIEAARAWVQAHARPGAARLVTCEDEAALIAALDALDADSPPEGPKQ